MTEQSHSSSQADTMNTLALQEQQNLQADTEVLAQMGGAAIGVELGLDVADGATSTESPANPEDLKQAGPFVEGQHFKDYYYGEDVEIIKVGADVLEFEFETEQGIKFLKDSHKSVARTLPLAEPLVSFEGTRAKVATLDVIEEFSREHLEPLGGSTIEMVLVNDSAEFTVELMVDYWADGKIPVATDPELYAHDATFHGLNVKAKPNAVSEVFQKVAQASKAKRESDPYLARKLAVGLGDGFESFYSPDNRRMFHESDFRDLFGRFEDIPDALSLVEQYIAEAPDVTVPAVLDPGENTPFVHGDIKMHPEKYPKIMSWLQWSYEGKGADHMKHVREVMLQKQEQMAGAQQAA